MAQPDSPRKLECALPWVDDFLAEFVWKNETQQGALTRGLVEVDEAVKGFLVREIQPETPVWSPHTDPEVVLVLRMEVSRCGGPLKTFLMRT